MAQLWRLTAKVGALYFRYFDIIYKNINQDMKKAKGRSPTFVFVRRYSHMLSEEFTHTKKKIYRFFSVFIMLAINS